MTDDLSHLITPEKQAAHEWLDALPAHRFICSNKGEDAPWHVGKKEVTRYARTGLISRAFYVARCNGKQLGGAWGCSQQNSLPAGAVQCSRCFKAG